MRWAVASWILDKTFFSNDKCGLTGNEKLQKYYESTKIILPGNWQYTESSVQDASKLGLS